MIDTKTMLILAARSGDHGAIKEAINLGIDLNEIFPERKNKVTVKHDEFDYIFVAYDEDYDNTHIELITTDLKKLLNMYITIILI